jgi:hypothetical protein
MGLFKDCGCGCGGSKARDKFVISVISALLFFIVANPSTFIIMRRILGAWVSSPNGCPSIAGLALHTVVFLLIVWGMMQIQKEGFAGEGESDEEIEISDEELKKIEAELDKDEDEDEDEDEEVPPMAEMPTAEPYMSEISFAPSPKNGKKSTLGSLDLGMDAQAAPIVSTKKKSGKYTSCKCADGNEIMLMR